MRRNTTVLILCGLMILANSMVVRQTLAVRDEMSWAFFGSAVFVETLAALAVVTLGVAIFRKRFQRQKKPVTRQGFAVVQPLRRLFATA